LPVPLFLLFGAVTAVGQIAGKLLYFYAARGSLHLPAFMHRAAAASQSTETLVPASGLPNQRRCSIQLEAVAQPTRVGMGGSPASNFTEATPST